MRDMKPIGSLPMLAKQTILLLRGSLAKVFMNQLEKIGMKRSKKSSLVLRDKLNRMMVLARLLSQLSQLKSQLETQVIPTLVKEMVVMHWTLEIQKILI